MATERPPASKFDLMTYTDGTAKLRFSTTGGPVAYDLDATALAGLTKQVLQYATGLVEEAAWGHFKA